jgi:tetratricopeptide (TPR) repeat protein
VIALEPRNEQNYYKRYRVYLRKNRLREALLDLDSAIEIKPNDENFLVNRGKLNVKLGKCSNAEIDFKNLARFFVLL